VRFPLCDGSATWRGFPSVMPPLPATWTVVHAAVDRTLSEPSIATPSAQRGAVLPCRVGEWWVSFLACACRPAVHDIVVFKALQARPISASSVHCLFGVAPLEVSCVPHCRSSAHVGSPIEGARTASG
jgi:hypothetical protein